MNKEIKFRVWDSKNKKFITEIPCKEYMLDEDEWDSDGLEEASFQYPSNLRTFRNRLIWQQYTGIKDRNGKEVFEGDIVQWYVGHFDFESQKMELFKYSDDIFKIECDLINGCHELQKRFEGYGELEIIGNNFENAELLTS